MEGREEEKRKYGTCVEWRTITGRLVPQDVYTQSCLHPPNRGTRMDIERRGLEEKRTENGPSAKYNREFIMRSRNIMGNRNKC